MRKVRNYYSRDLDYLMARINLLSNSVYSYYFDVSNNRYLVNRNGSLTLMSDLENVLSYLNGIFNDLLYEDSCLDTIEPLLELLLKKGSFVVIAQKYVDNQVIYGKYQNKYTIDIDNVGEEYLDLSVRIDLLSDNDKVVSTIYLPRCSVPIADFKCYHNSIYLFLTAIDKHILSFMQSLSGSLKESINPDFILWLDSNIMGLLGCTSESRNTKSVHAALLLD